MIQKTMKCQRILNLKTVWSNDFSRSLDFAQRSEIYIGSVLENLYGFQVNYYNNDNKFDLHTNLQDGTEFTIEVKDDPKHKDTGNAVVEYKSRGKTSGVWVTQSNLWIHRLYYPDRPVESWMFSTNDLISSIKNREWYRLLHLDHTDSCNDLYVYRGDILKTFKSSRKMVDFNSKVMYKWEQWYEREVTDGVVNTPFRI